MKKNIGLAKGFWQCLVSVGMNGVDEKEGKYIKFTNVIAVMSAVAVFLYIPFSLHNGFFLLSALQSVDVICILAVLLFNHLAWHRAARLLYIFVINTFVLINSCFIGYESRVHDFFYIVYIVPFLFFSVKDYKNIVTGVSISIIFFNLYQIIYPHFEQYNLDLPTQHLIATINLWMKFVLFGIAIYILSYYNYMTEAELAESNQKLQDQTAELQRSNHDLEQFAAIISHDLKAPVRNVSSFMSLLMRRHGAILDSEAQNFIELSKNSADRMARQIDDLLSYSKVGRNLPATGTVDLNSMIAVIQIELGEKIKDKNTRIMILDELPILRNVHASMIHHIFQNLISNAVKFNTGDRPEVKIGSTMSADDYTFSVSDNGIGIDDDHKDKLFNMFRRLHSESEFEGSGVGLAVCKKIVDFYGGRIWMESTKGIGTTFYFTLPRRRGATSLTYSAKFTDVAYSQPVLAS